MCLSSKEKHEDKIVLFLEQLLSLISFIKEMLLSNSLISILQKKKKKKLISRTTQF
jgi:hypothetical protein